MEIAFKLKGDLMTFTLLPSSLLIPNNNPTDRIVPILTESKIPFFNNGNWWQKTRELFQRSPRMRNDMATFQCYERLTFSNNLHTVKPTDRLYIHR